MNKVYDIIAMIPARIGSTRLSKKNLALLDQKPLIAHAIEAAKQSQQFTRIVINSDSPVFKKIADRYGVEFYHRPLELGSSTTKSDHVVYDFIKKNPCDLVCWVNPTSPLQTGDEIKTVIEHFIDHQLDTLITVCGHQVHAALDGQPINYKMDELFAQTQDLTPVQTFVYSIMMWNSQSFVKAFDQDQQAFFVGKVGLFPVSKLSAIIIKTKEDLMLAEYVIQSLKQNQNYQITYDPLAEEESL